MAVLQKIRNRAGIFVVIFVGVALFLFIIDPTTFQGLFMKQDTSIAEINGEKVDYKEFNENYNFHRNFLLVAQRKTNLEPDEDESVREQAWKDILNKYILEPNFEKVGINVSDEELEDLLWGSNIHYIILQNFTNQETGKVDTANIKNFFQKAYDDPNYTIIAEYWKAIIKKDRMNTKYNNMVKQGFYTPTTLAKMDYLERNTTYDILVLVRRYKDIADESIKITDADIKEYYDNNKHMFKVDKRSRDMEYVVFSIIPSAEDTLKAKQDITDLLNNFLKEEDVLTYAKRYSEVKFPEKYLNSNELPMGISPEFFEKPVGTVSDIVLSNNAFLFTKIIDVAEKPDSVKASHILIRPSENLTLEQCNAKADSLMKLIEKGEDFAVLALMNSEDPGSKNSGGDLGWFTEGIMVKEFNDACFEGKPGDIKKVETQFGVHIIKIVEQTKPHRKIKLATVAKEINFSDKTSNFYFSQASQFASMNNTSEKFDKAVSEQKLTKRIATNINDIDNKLPGIENAREMVRWLYDENTKKGDVSHVFVFQDKYIVAKVAAIREKGYADIEDVKDRIQPIVLKNKKAEILISELEKDLNSLKDLSSIASKYNIDLDTVNNVSFASFSIPGHGIEPKINAVASTIGKGKTSKPIKGNNGVYVIKVLDEYAAPEKTDFTAEQLNLMRNMASQTYRIFESLEKKANVIDKRAKFF